LSADFFLRQEIPIEGVTRWTSSTVQLITGIRADIMLPLLDKL